MITIESKGSFAKTEAFFQAMKRKQIFSALDHYGRLGVSALQQATPVDSGQSARSWSYEILRDGKSYSIIWTNSNIVAGTPVVILLQYGHGTGTGGYVEGRDFINPAIQPIFDKISTEVWKVVTSA